MIRALAVGLVALTAACDGLILSPISEPDAARVYDELWEVFDRRYAPFEVRGVDWDVAYARHRPTSSATSGELWGAATALLAELDDGHVTLLAPRRHVFVAQQSFREETHWRKLDLGIVYGRMIEGPFESGPARFGVLPQDVGYVRVGHFQDHIPDLPRVLAALQPRRAVVVDLRHNPGGDFQHGFELASAFADRSRLAFTTLTKTGPGRDELGQRVEWRIEPRGPIRVEAPVVVLTNQLTNSAAERTLMALRALPQVTVVGSPTAGNLGEKVGGELSNGWRFSLVPQLVFDHEGRVHEGSGIPPDVRVDNTEEEVSADVDRQLDAALELLGAYATGP